MRFGIWIAVRIFEKFVLSLEVLLVSAIFVSLLLRSMKNEEADLRADYALQVSTWNYQ